MIRIVLVVALLVVGGWIGKNLHDGQPWYSNPFASKKETLSLVDKASETATEALGSGLQAVGEGGKHVAESIDQASTSAIKKGEQLKGK